MCTVCVCLIGRPDIIILVGSFTTEMYSMYFWWDICVYHFCLLANFLEIPLSVCLSPSQGSTVTVCVLRAAGGRIALCPVTVRMERPAHLMKEPANVLLVLEAPPASGVSILCLCDLN